MQLLRRLLSFFETAFVRRLEMRRILLSPRESQLFAEALINPGEPSERLKEAFRRQDLDVESRD